MSYPESIFIVDDQDMPENSALRKPGDDSPYIPTVMVPATAIVAADKSGKLAEALNLAALPGMSPLVARTLLSSAAGGAMLGPLSMLVGVATAGASLYSAVMEGKEAASKQRLEQDARELQRYLELHAVSPERASEFEFEFAPGHPRIGVRYRLHPLARVRNSTRKNLYIPEESFDQTLLDERESELLKLLVELGATRVNLTERRVRAEAASFAAEVSGAGGPVVEAGAAVRHGEKKNQDHLDSRVFEMVGKRKTAEQQIDEADFAWLPFEPAWKSLVRAREVGQCTRAVIELKQETAYSNEVQVSLELKMAAYGGVAKAAKALSEMVSRSYVFEVDFAPFVATRTDLAVGDRA